MLAGCEKNEDYCWDCYVYVFTQDLSKGTLDIYYDTIPKCGYTERDARRFEDSHSVMKTCMSTCCDVIRWADCICEK